MAALVTKLCFGQKQCTYIAGMSVRGLPSALFHSKLGLVDKYRFTGKSRSMPRCRRYSRGNEASRGSEDPRERSLKLMDFPVDPFFGFGTKMKGGFKIFYSLWRLELKIDTHTHLQPRTFITGAIQVIT